MSRRVLILVMEGSRFFDIAGPAEVIDAARSLGAPYELHCVGIASARSTRLGIQLSGIEPLPEPEETDWIIVPGLSVFDGSKQRVHIPDPVASVQEREWLKRAAAAGARLSSVCGGAFALGEAGILNHRPATCHWLVIKQFQKRFPLVKVTGQQVFVDDGRVITSAGSSAGIDMTLHLVERDCGPVMAADVARGLILYQRRPGSDPQLSVHLRHRGHMHPGIHRLQDWLSHHFHQPASLHQLARTAGMSVRSLTRDFRKITGMTVLDFRELLRLDHAQRMAQDASLSLEEVASRSGFGGARQLHRVWRKHSPSAPLRRRTG